MSIEALYPPRPDAGPPRFRVAWLRHGLWLGATLLALTGFGLAIAVILGASLLVLVYGGALAVLTLPALIQAWSEPKAFAIWLTALLCGVGMVLLGAGAVAILVAQLFGRPTRDPTLRALDLDTQPRLREFLDRLAGDVRTQIPGVVWLVPDATMAIANKFGGIRQRLGPPHLFVGLALLRILDVNEFKAIVAHEYAHYGQSGSRVGQWAHRATYSIVQILARGRFDEWLVLQSSSQRPLVASFGGLMMTSAELVRRLLGGMLEWVLWCERALGREMEFDADAQAVREAGSDAVVSSLWKAVRADLAFDDTMSVAAYLARDGRFAANLFEVFDRRLTEIDGKLEPPDHPMVRALCTPYQPGQGLHFPAGPSMVTHRFDSHPSLLDREQAAKTPYLPAGGRAKSGPSPSAWALLDEPDRLCAELTRDCYTRMGFTPIEVLDIDAFERILAAELQGFAHLQNHHGFYDNRLLRLGDFEELLGALERGQLNLATLDEEVARWRGPALAEYMATLHRLQAEFDQLQAVCETPMAARTQWVRVGARSIPCNTAESAREILRTQISELVALVELGDRTLFAWTWVILDGERRAELVTHYRFLLELQTLIPRLGPHHHTLHHALSVVAQQDRQRTRAATEAVVDAARAAHRELAAVLHRCEQLSSSALRGGEAITSVRAQIGVELPELPERETELLGWAHAMFNTLALVSDRVSTIHDRVIGSILALQQAAETHATASARVEGDLQPVSPETTP